MCTGCTNESWDCSCVDKNKRHPQDSSTYIWSNWNSTCQMAIFWMAYASEGSSTWSISKSGVTSCFRCQPVQTSHYGTISNLNCHANLNLQDCVESVPGHVESAKPSCCRLLCSVFKGYTSISLILIHSCCFISVLTNTASGKSGKRSPDPLQLPRFSHL
jgi:hypothetical protein